jgi:excisionase family DNA binding protein
MSESFVPIEDIAKHFSVSISTVRAWVRQKHIPEDTYIKIGSTYRFRVSDVESALTSSKTAKKSFDEAEYQTRRDEIMNNIQALESSYEYDLDDDQ